MSAVDHPDVLKPTEWWACTEPERPADTHTRFWSPCDSCYLALVATVRISERPMWLTVEADAPLRGTAPADVLSQVEAFRAERGLFTVSVAPDATVRRHE